MAKSTKPPKQVETLTHKGSRRRNIPTAELQSHAQRAEELSPRPPVHYPRRTPLTMGATRPRDGELDPQLVWKGARIHLTDVQLKEAAAKGYIDVSEAQLVWKGKDQQDWSDLVVQTPPLYIQEKIHPKAIIDDLAKRTKAKRDMDAPDLFHDFNGIDPDAKTEFYQHDQNWANRFILGDSLQVMASLAEREGLRGQVQCIYFDPPYGIKFNSNWQVSTRSRDVKDGKMEEISREPEQVRAFRDTWKEGIHSYLTYLRDRLTVMRDLLTESGSIFVQIGDENVHRVRALLDEVFGPENFVSEITFQKTGGQTSDHLPAIQDYILWFAKNLESVKFRRLHNSKELGVGHGSGLRYDQTDASGRAFQLTSLTSNRPPGSFPVTVDGTAYRPSGGYWKTGEAGFQKLIKANRVRLAGRTLRYVRYLDDFAAYPITNIWTDVAGSVSKVYVVQTSRAVVERCILMATDPGDLVLDPTCGSGTTATVAEQWGRRWITVDTSRVALALARARVMGARYPYYLLADSAAGRMKEAELTGRPPKDGATHGDIRQGFVYDRAPHITLKSIANNAEIDVIWGEYQAKMEPIRAALNAALSKKWEEWDIPRAAAAAWPDRAKGMHADWWTLRIARQKAIDASIAKKADVELLYDRPYEDKSRIRVAGPFTVESLSPHRAVPSDEAELIGDVEASEGKRRRTLPKQVEGAADFTQMILDHLKTSGVQQAKKDDRIRFDAIAVWPGDYVAAEARFLEGTVEKRAAIFIGPEFGTVSRHDLIAASREALDARFDVLIACAFNFEAHTSELNKLGPLPILKAKMNPELHMSDELKNTGAGNLFVVFGEPDIQWSFTASGEIVVEVLGVDVFDPKTGEVRASGKDDIAAWFIDTDYDQESFFVRHAYFMGANDPYKSLKTALKAEIDEDAWATLYRDKSRPFPRPKKNFAVKVINHFGDEVMKVFAV
ncbi:MAG TPA: site-specific DNA-methyltransferase [Alphaproteobacteria bacterium]|nr:site-specific DNA-methyltransferase [Alphaproteobacteria bacterium]